MTNDEATARIAAFRADPRVAGSGVRTVICTTSTSPDTEVRILGRLVAEAIPAKVQDAAREHGLAGAPPDLARLLVAAPRWRWVQGMRGIWSYDETDNDAPMYWGCDDRRGFVSCGPLGDGSPECNGGSIPDLADPATAGCLLAMLVADDPASGWGVSCGPDVGWRATSCEHDIGGESMGTALAAALLACWGGR